MKKIVTILFLLIIIITKNFIIKMKHFGLTFLLLFIALCLASCQKDEDERLYASPPDVPGLVDGGKISGISLYCLEKDGNRMVYGSIITLKPKPFRIIQT